MVSIVILSSGFSNRMGRDKLLTKLNDISIIERTILNAVKSRANEVIIIYRDERINDIAGKYGIKAIYNENANQGQSAAIRCGLENVTYKDGVMFLPGDMPYFDSESINFLIDEYEKSKGIICPVCLGIRMAPVIFSFDYSEELKKISGDTGGRVLLQKYSQKVREVFFKNVKLFWDIDDEIDLKMSKRKIVLIRGAGDIASGVALRLYRAGFNIIMLETKNPSVIRRRVSFATAVYEDRVSVEGIEGILVRNLFQIENAWREGIIPVIIDEEADILNTLEVDVIVDAILAKKNVGTRSDMAKITIGLGPGFEAGVDVHAVVETNRGHFLGRVYYNGRAEENTGIPGDILGYKEERVLRAPCNGKVKLIKDIGDFVKKDEAVLTVDDVEVNSKIDGVIRGLINDSYEVYKNMKIGDVDPRGKIEHCYTVSEKALAIAGGVLEAILKLGGL